ncbi:MAG: signal recognition particle-docking protein FtsY [Cyanothece sp. SIO2G6]|nr:signal recognition particle-docking protein FtsY [Cyanothece sp. SIO2G6]
MAFNWFKRQLGGKQTEETSESPSPQPAESSSQSDSPAKAPETETVADTAPTNAEDYLQWAKAAYQSIQQQQSSSPDTASATVDAAAESSSRSTPEEANDAPVAEMSEPSTAVDGVTDTSGDTVIPESSDSAEANGANSAEALAEAVMPTSLAGEDGGGDASEAIAPDSPADVTSATESNPEPSPSATPTPLPFWAKAEAERQERLERLKETAIEEEVEPESPEVELDEDFVWSAGVLASQGRRPDQVSAEEITWLTKLRQGLGKTRRGLINQLRSVVGQGPLNAAAVMEIEDLLLQADVGVDATDYVIEALQGRMREGALPPDEAIAYLKDILRGILDQPFASGEYATEFVPDQDCLNVWMLTGVNGAGKTTTIGKLAHMTRSSDYRCLIAAADTFRAAAVEQVKTWGDRSGVEVIANPGKNTDPAAVVFDAIAAAQARNTNVLLVDTAGRLQNKKNLMDELGKIRRIVDKKATDAKVESLLVLDATLGQNGLRQAQVFSEAAKLSGVVLTKLDGSAKGGVALAVVHQLGLPIRFIGAGEGIEDLRPFSSYEFVEALLSD